MTKALVEQKKNILVQAMPEMAKVLPACLNPTRVLRVYQNAITKSPRLAECTNTSLLQSMMTCSEFGLEPNTPAGHCYIIPYKDQAQFQLGYKGLVVLAYRCGAVKNISAHAVYEQDKFELEYGDTPKVKHIPYIGDDAGVVTVYYAAVTLSSGNVCIAAMTPDQARKHGQKFSKSFNKPDSPWQTNFDSMALKTVLIKALKTVPVEFDSQLTEALSRDADYIDIPASGGKTVYSLDDLAEAAEPVTEPEVDLETGECVQGELV
jgi:recombination protein RecT